MKILTSPSSFGQISDKPNQLLRSEGYEIVNNPFGRKLTSSELISIAEDCIGIVAGVESYTPEVIDALPLLKCISRVGVGMDAIDISYAEERGIIVLNTPDGPTRSVAEFTLAMTMALLRRIPQADSLLKKKLWQKQTGSLLQSKIVGVVGLGRIGKTVAEIFLALGNHVLAYDLIPDRNWARENRVEIVDLKTVLQASDIITLHIPSSTSGKPIIGYDELNIIKDHSFLINLSRGNVVDEEALYHKLSSGKISGAAIDVFSREPYDGILCDLDNVVLTPHIGSYAKEGKINMEIQAVNNLIQYLG
mgnify:CR=1 FL=1|jgi:D-3-phosphoglycerate dehydrogenase / 2-oxoglutarate reductase